MKTFPFYCDNCEIANQIIRLRGRGFSQKEIAKELMLSQQVISYHLRRIKKAYLAVRE
jgi:DNA-binding CsgD family transcriptional regulator